MGVIRNLLSSELVGGTDNTKVYPVTSTKAVYDTDNKDLDTIINNIKDSISNKLDSSSITQELGDSTVKTISQKVITEKLNDKENKSNVFRRGSGGYLPWQSGKSYNDGDVVISPDGQLVECMGGTSSIDEYDPGEWAATSIDEQNKKRDKELESSILQISTDKIDKSSVTQTIGNNTESIISQDATTKALTGLLPNQKASETPFITKYINGDDVWNSFFKELDSASTISDTSYINGYIRYYLNGLRVDVINRVVDSSSGSNRRLTQVITGNISLSNDNNLSYNGDLDRSYWRIFSNSKWSDWEPVVKDVVGIYPTTLDIRGISGTVTEEQENEIQKIISAINNLQVCILGTGSTGSNPETLVVSVTSDGSVSNKTFYLKAISTKGVIYTATCSVSYDIWEGNTYGEWVSNEFNIEDEINKVKSKIEKFGTTEYTVCSAAGYNSEKFINIDSFALNTSSRLLVKMTNANLANDVTFKINISSGSIEQKPLYFNGMPASSTNSWRDGDILDIHYDGTNFQAYNHNQYNYPFRVIALSADNIYSNVPESIRTLGFVITYKLNGVNIIEQYIGSDTTDSNWNNKSNWKKVAYDMNVVLSEEEYELLEVKDENAFYYTYEE